MRGSPKGATIRRSFSYFSTPIAVYLSVMLPICGLEVFLIFSRCPGWIQWTAGGVLGLSLYGLAIGYGRRLTLGEDGASFRGLFGSVKIEWHQLRRIGIYQPGGGIGQTEYAYLSTRDEPPTGKWEQD